MIKVRRDLDPVTVLPIPRLRAGSVVVHRGQQKTVEKVILRGYDLHLGLRGGDEVHSDQVQPVIDSVHVFPREHRYWNKEPRRGELSVGGSSSPQAV